MDDFILNQEEVTPYEDSEDLYGTKIKPIPVPERNIGIDTDNEFFESVIEAAQVSKLDIGAIESFSQISQNRNLVYNVLDTMCEDGTIAAVVETYAEDATETNDDGRVVWAEAEDSEVSSYITYILDSLNVDKFIYTWVHSLAKYGDLYLRLYKESDYKAPVFVDDSEISKKDIVEPKKLNESADTLNEEVVMKMYKPDDKFAHYVEMVPNPAEMFELTRFGKTYSYIQAESTAIKAQNKTDNMLYSNAYKYFFHENDVKVYDATQFVHASLQDNTSRTPEEVELFFQDHTKHKHTNADGVTEEEATIAETSNMSFKVNRGQSILYSAFKDWRNLTLLTNSLLLNRLSKSSIVRVVNVEVGDMPKESVAPHLMGIKNMIEQKTAISQGQSLNEYTNPGPIENNIYVATHNGVGSLSTTEVGGDVNPGTLTDIDYFTSKLFGDLKVPKQYFGQTGDNAGFSGGESLALLSSRYAKTVVRLQNTMIQALTDAINIFLIDKGLDKYINKYQLHMVRPTTQEEKNRKENKISQIGVIRDTMDLLGDIEDKAARLKILKNLLSSVIDDSDISQIIQEVIEELEASNGGMEDELMGGDLSDNFHEPSGSADLNFGDINIDTGEESTEGTAPEETSGGADELPTPGELGLDLTDNNAEF